MPLRYADPHGPSDLILTHSCSFLWEKFITLWNYYFVSDLTPAHRGLFEGTPVGARIHRGADHR